MIVDDTTRMPPDELNSRPSLLHLDTVPVMGKNFDVLLLRADAVVSAPCGKEALGQRVLAVSQDDLTRSDAEFLAVALPNAIVLRWSFRCLPRRWARPWCCCLISECIV